LLLPPLNVFMLLLLVLVLLHVFKLALVHA
jgi:hypothetical protein